MMMRPHARGSSHAPTPSSLSFRSLYAPGSKAVLLQEREEIDADINGLLRNSASR